MDRKRSKQTLIQHLSPECGFVGLLTIFGCAATVYFTYSQEWSPWAFGTVFTGILVPGKGIKILDNMVGKKK